jgi:hypothetical protein
MQARGLTYLAITSVTTSTGTIDLCSKKTYKAIPRASHLRWREFAVTIYAGKITSVLDARDKLFHVTRKIRSPRARARVRALARRTTRNGE